MRDVKEMLVRMKNPSYSKGLNQKISEQNSKFAKDERLWALTRDKDTGKGEAVIRFLPPFNEGDFPYEKYYEHFVKRADGKWLVVEACNRSFGKPCPVCERASRFWQAGDKDSYRNAKGKSTYIFNVLVVDDKAVPENNGKVFMVKLGATIYNMIVGAMNSEFEDEARQPFDIFNGHNFIYRSRKDPAKGGQISYDKSKFEDNATAIADTDEAVMKILEQMHDLKAYVKDQNSRWTDEQLEARCREAFAGNDPGSSFNVQQGSYGGGHQQAPASNPVSEPMPSDEEDDCVPFSKAGSKADASASKPVAEPVKSALQESSDDGGDGDDDDDDLDFFRKLA